MISLADKIRRQLDLANANALATIRSDNDNPRSGRPARPRTTDLLAILEQLSRE